MVKRLQKMALGIFSVGIALVVNAQQVKYKN